jgi:hypothetical protein
MQSKGSFGRRFRRAASRIGLVLALVVALLGAMAPASRVHAATRVVSNTNDSGAGSLRQAIIDAGNGDVITFDPYVFAPGALHTITLTSGVLEINKQYATVTIQGPGRSLLAISGNRTSAVFELLFGTARISGMTIENGTAHSGGGIWVGEYARLALSDSTIRGSGASTYGGGIYNEGTVTVANSTISGNTSWNGGGIYNHKGEMTVSNSTIARNSASDSSGGVYNGPGGSLILAASRVDGNTALRRGGGLYSEGTASVTGRSTISGNSAHHGGGILNTAKLSVADSTIHGNKMGSQTLAMGGGIANYTGGTLTVSGSTISGNAAAIENHGNGGGIYNQGTVTITNSTIANNRAQYGGGLRNAGATTLSSVTIAGNTATEYGAISNYWPSSTSKGTTAIVNSIVKAGSAGGTCGTYPGGITSRGHNIETGNSCGFTAAGDKVNTNPMLGSLANNGGPTLTMALQPGSPAIGAGDNAACPATDQRGLARPRLKTATLGEVCDIGAYEHTHLGLVGYWALNEDGGTTTADGSGSGNTGTLRGGAAWAAGRWGSAVRFNGTSASVSAGVNRLPAANQPQSISLWLRVGSLPSGIASALSLTNDSKGSGVQMGYRSGRFGVWKYGGAFLVSTASVPAANAWHHVTYTFDGTTHRLYLNGTFVSQSTVAPQTSVPTALTLGAWSNSEYLAGTVDNVRIYKRALGEGEVLLLSATP